MFRIVKEQCLTSSSKSISHQIIQAVQGWLANLGCSRARCSYHRTEQNKIKLKSDHRFGGGSHSILMRNEELQWRNLDPPRSYSLWNCDGGCQSCWLCHRSSGQLYLPGAQLSIPLIDMIGYYQDHRCHTSLLCCTR